MRPSFPGTPGLLRVLLLSAALLALAGCQSNEERAARFFRSGMELLEAGDPDRALVEFRNVFRYDPLHREARLAFARIQRERGKAGDAYGQYLRVAEQYPEDLEARIALAEMAIGGANWEEAERHTAAARALAPEAPAVILVQAMLDYRAAMLAGDRAAAAAAVAVARARLAEEPADLIARRMVLDYLTTGPDRAAAQSEVEAEVEAAIAAHPEQLDFHMLRLQLAAEREDDPATQSALETMVGLFPENAEVRKLLIAWYLSQGDLAGAEAFLRQLAEAPGAGLAERLAVVEFLRQTEGLDAAAAELDRLIAAAGAAGNVAGNAAGEDDGDETGVATYRAMRATVDFEQGRRSEGIAALEALIAGAEPSDETRDLEVVLARMLIAVDDAVGARARVEQVLAADAEHVEALKLRAAWLIEDDRPGEAIAALRTALAQAPRDTDALTLMAQAHERDGARDLAGERYALAVEVSGRTPPSSLRYAAFLLEDDRLDAAEAVIEDALAVSPLNIELMSAMSEIQIRKGAWDRVTRLVWQLRAIGSAEADATANDVEVEFLLRQGRVADTLSFLGELAQDTGTGAAAKARIVEIQVREGRLDEARAFLETELAAAPEDPLLRYLRAGLHVLENAPGDAETIYRALVAEHPGAARPLTALTGLLQSQGRDDEALALIETAIAADPEAAMPRFLKAGALETAGDIEGAIAVYEALYTGNSGDLLVANNLASLLAAHRPDAESLERAFTIARRLRGSGVPAFQDTYGWIEYRRGNHEEALALLEPAAAGLPQDPLVQVHLGMAYRALDRLAEARETLTRALGIAGDSPLSQFEEARKALAEIGAE